MRRHDPFRTFALAAASLCACTVGDLERADADETCVGKCDEADATEPVVGELLRCWVDPGDGSFFEVDQMSCKPSLGPLALFATAVEVKTNAARHRSLLFQGESLDARVLEFRREDFPLEVTVNLSLHPEEPLADLGVHRLSTQFTVAGADALPAGAPEIVAFPLRTESLNLLAAVTVDQVDVEYTLDVSPFVIGSPSQGAASQQAHVEVRDGTSLRFGERREFPILAVNESPQVSVTARVEGVERTHVAAAPAELEISAGGIAMFDPSTSIPAGSGVASCFVENGNVLCRSALPLIQFEAQLVDGAHGAVVLTDAPVIIGPAPDGANAQVELRGTLPEGLRGIDEYQLPNGPMHMQVEVHRGSPTAVSLPFDLWTVQLRATGGVALLDLPPYELALGLLWPERYLARGGEETLDFSSGDATFMLAVPAQTQSLPCKAVHVDAAGVVHELEVELTPGAHELTPEGLQPLM